MGYPVTSAETSKNKMNPVSTHEPIRVVILGAGGRDFHNRLPAQYEGATNTRKNKRDLLASCPEAYDAGPSPGGRI